MAPGMEILNGLFRFFTICLNRETPVGCGPRLSYLDGVAVFYSLSLKWGTDQKLQKRLPAALKNWALQLRNWLWQRIFIGIKKMRGIVGRQFRATVWTIGDFIPAEPPPRLLALVGILLTNRLVY